MISSRVSIGKQQLHRLVLEFYNGPNIPELYEAMKERISR